MTDDDPYRSTRARTEGFIRAHETGHAREALAAARAIAGGVLMPR
jgi:hypothetical protein